MAPKPGAKKGTQASKPAGPKPARKPSGKTAKPQKPSASSPGHKPEKQHKGGTPPALTEKDIPKVIEVLRASGGIKTVAAQRLNVGRTTLYKFIGENPTVTAALAEIDSEIVDVAEAQVVKAINGGDMQTVRWFLEMKAKDRGYVRRVENVGKGGGPIETREKPDLSGYTEAELAQLIAIEEARERRETGATKGK